MFFLQAPPPGQYDLNFRIFGIPVRVHPWFWALSALLGWVDGRLDLTIVWMLCVFVSILVHELGHALSARAFGWPPHIVLYSMGGLAMFEPHYGYTRRRAIWISFAGPLAGFLLFGVVVATHFGIVWAAQFYNQDWAIRLLRNDQFAWMLRSLEWINLGWGLFNLLPVLPLDGGRISSELFNARGSLPGRRRSFQVGMVCGALAAAWFLNQRMYFGGLMFAGLAYENYRAADQLRRGW